MEEENKESSDFVEKMDKGLELSRERLIKAKAEAGGYLVYEKDGKIIKVKASDL